MSGLTSWRSVPIADLVQDRQISYGIVQPGNDIEAGVPIVRVKDLQSGIIDTRSPLRVDPVIARKHDRTTLCGGELLLSLVGTVGEAAIAPADLNGWNVARAIAVIRPEGITAQWLKFCFVSPLIRHELRRVLNTTVQATLNLADLKKIKMPVPPRPVMDAIVEVLGAFDDKIAANTKLALTADTWVRSAYDYVSLGSQEKVVLGQLITFVKDLVDPSLVPVDTVYVGLEHIPRRLMWLDSYGTSVSIASTKSRFSTGDVLFGKLRPYFHKVVSAPVGGVCSTDVFVVRPADAKIAGFVLSAITGDEVVQRCTAASEGTRMPRVSWKDLAAVEVAWPGEAAALALSVKITNLRDAVESRMRENEMLATMRDALLPQLMSGKVRVKDAEKTVEEVL